MLFTFVKILRGELAAGQEGQRPVAALFDLAGIDPKDRIQRASAEKPRRKRDDPDQTPHGPAGDRKQQQRNPNNDTQRAIYSANIPGHHESPDLKKDTFHI
jgi:hypothetical protein